LIGSGGTLFPGGCAHRPGQTRRVFAWRLVSIGTVEQRVPELQRQKPERVDRLRRGAGAFRLDAGAIDALFAPMDEPG